MLGPVERGPGTLTEVRLTHTPYPAPSQPPTAVAQAPGSPGNEDSINLIPDKTPFHPAVICVVSKPERRMKCGKGRRMRPAAPETANPLDYMLSSCQGVC